MKKQILTAILAFAISGAYAQDLVSKKGEPYLPEEGDWAIGVDATPFLNYFGNFLSSNGNSAPDFNFVDQQAIVGKYFVTANTAFRAAVRINHLRSSSRAFVANDLDTTTAVFPNVNEQLEDAARTSSTNVVLAVGYEKRRGTTRLQGFYGGDLLFLIGNGSRTTYEYGNELTTTNTNPTRTTFITNPSPFGGNVLESKTGGSLGFGVRGFIGAEYFIIPKLSLAGEFGWGVIFSSQGESSITSEAYNANTNTVGETELITSNKSSTFRLDTDNFPTAQGSIRIIFHF